MIRTLRVVAALLLLAGAPLEAQFLSPGGVTGGFQGVVFRFGDFLPVRALQQWALPVAAVVPAGRFSFDIGAHYATTTRELQDGTLETVAGWTDTQLRGAVVLGQDVAVLTALVNLPTGADRLSREDYQVLAAASSSFFGFPVNAYGSGPSITAGAATAFPAGAWTLGVAASARFSGEFTPITHPDGDFTYRAGVEGRLRLGADRLIGNGRLSFGLTASNFSDDRFAGGGAGSGIYQPGQRFIGEVSYAGVVGGATVVAYAWDYYRTSGDSAGTTIPNRENVLAGGASARVPLSRSVAWEPSAEVRWIQPEGVGQGVLVELVSGFRIRATRRLTIVPALRLDVGRLDAPCAPLCSDSDEEIGHPIRGIGLSVFVRESF